MIKIYSLILVQAVYTNNIPKLKVNINTYNGIITRTNITTYLEICDGIT